MDGYGATMRVANERGPEYLDMIVRCLELADVWRPAPGGGFPGKNLRKSPQNLVLWGVLEKLPDELQKRGRRTVYYRFPDEAGVQRAMKELAKLT